MNSARPREFLTQEKQWRSKCPKLPCHQAKKRKKRSLKLNKPSLNARRALSLRKGGSMKRSLSI